MNEADFTPTVKAVQARKGLRPAHRRIEERGGWRTAITPDLAEFIAAQTSVFLATANRDGQPLFSAVEGDHGLTASGRAGARRGANGVER